MRTMYQGDKDCGLHEDKAAEGKLSTVNREGRRSRGLPALNRPVESVPPAGCSFGQPHLIAWGSLFNFLRRTHVI
jgi:hypothetical protein